MNVLPIDHKIICAGIHIILMMLSLSITAHANQQDDYLRALETEASELKDFKPPPDAMNTEAADIAENTVKAIDDMSPKEKEFSDRLKSTLPNTYLIYQKLSKSQKGLVVESYFVNDRSMAEASRQIFNIYFKKIKTN
ncbi:MAG: hypothetical protein OQK76_08475 [Gammaproteobacteria bacterium]|nr:hypothetical protein [Gammaproteobacteria bacterium]MCW9005035.1 hypothetical protein [Gammaproteobacteria bacterium]MCW9056950.1 hypothetical protein [Gammaproteobacteria bacterium]